MNQNETQNNDILRKRGWKRLPLASAYLEKTKPVSV
jgi:hypothetical protein